MRTQHEEMQPTESTAQLCRGSCKAAALEKAGVSQEPEETRERGRGRGQPAAEYYQQ